LSSPIVTQPLSILLSAGIALALGGCDTEKGTAPQGAERTATPTNSASSETARYRIDRSQAGTPIADVQVRGPNGTLRSLRSLAGRPVVLNLWATWCAPCVEELPTLEAMAARIGNAGQVVLLSQDLGEADVPSAFLADRNIRTPQNWHDPENEVGLAAGGNLPTTILYDREGKEVLRVNGPLDWAGAEARALLREVGI
jgi:thiol-disulfide isomerase/thioredoxin